MTLLESAVASLFPLPAALVMQQQQQQQRQFEAHAWEGTKGLVDPGRMESESCLEHHKVAEAGTWQHLGSLVEVAFAPNSLAWWISATGTEHKASQHVSGCQGKEDTACKGGFLQAAVHCTWHRGACTHPEEPRRGKETVPQPEAARWPLQVQVQPRLLLVEYKQVVVVQVQVGVAVPA